MRKSVATAFAAALAYVIGLAIYFYVSYIVIKVSPQIEIAHNPIPPMILVSPGFKDGEMIPKKYTRDGVNINPELRIEGAPDGTKSFALIADDPDAPNGTFTHWLVWNIGPKISMIKEESMPPGAIEGKNDRGEIGYTGPYPPSGTHHYHFKLYALDAILNLREGADKATLQDATSGHMLASAELVGLYAR